LPRNFQPARRPPPRPFFEANGTITSGQILLPVSICAPKAQGDVLVASTARRSFDALIDTGATSSVIHPRLQAELALPIIDQRPIVVADGRQELVPWALAIVVFGAKAGGEITKLFRCAVVAGNYHMLFGMDLLAGSMFTVDGNAMTWRLRIRL
jgi:predicted aspartyl protease